MKQFDFSLKYWVLAWAALSLSACENSGRFLGEREVRDETPAATEPAPPQASPTPVEPPVTAPTTPVTPPLPTVSSFTFNDPAPTAEGEFGRRVLVLDNGNIVISKPGDSTVASRNGAVYLVDPVTQNVIKSFHGDQADDRLGTTELVSLENGNFVIVSHNDTVNGNRNAGSVMVVNGSTGELLATIGGDDRNDNLGEQGITVINNSRFVISSTADIVNGLDQAGSAKLVNSSTGAVIATVSGGQASERLGRSGIVALNNGNFVIGSEGDQVNGLNQAGSAILVNGSTGGVIATIGGDQAFDGISSDGMVALPNGNFVVLSRRDQVNGVNQAGSAKLVNGSTGAVIATIAGDQANDEIGGRGAVSLGNGNFTLASPSDDVNGIVDAGSVRLINGSTGAEIALLSGDQVNDQLGATSRSSRRIQVLSNHNFVVVSQSDDVNGVNNAGSVQLVNGTTGAVIGSIAGETAQDNLGESFVRVLSNDNYVITTGIDDENGIVSAGSAILASGTTGTEIARISGDNQSDVIGNNPPGVLANSNYLIPSISDTVNGVNNAGSVRLVNGTSGEQIAVLAGETENDNLGSNLFTLSNSNAVIVSNRVDVNGVVDAGTVKFINGSTGAVVRPDIIGTTADDIGSFRLVEAPDKRFFVIGMNNFDNNGLVNSGRVEVIALQ